VTVEGVVQPNAAPRFSRTPGDVQGPAPAVGEHNEQVFADWHVTPARRATEG
jgi:alpha-methylacyl-CoA racemase